MKNEIDLVSSIRNNRKVIWICLAVLIIVLVAGFFFIKFMPVEKNYISSSEFKVINGEESLWLFLGTYHRITTLADVVSVVRSTEVLESIMDTYDINMSIADFRQNIDLYDLGDMNFRLDLIYPEQILGEKINISLIYTYLDVIESRMDNDNKEIFDVKVVSEPVSREMGSRNAYKMIGVFIFGLFCAIIIILIVLLIKLISGKKYGKK